MRSPFKTPLPVSSKPAEYGHVGEQLDVPFETVDLNDAIYPDTPFGGDQELSAAYRSTVGDKFQSSNPEWARPYEPYRTPNPGASPASEDGYSIAPAPGSTDLAFPRDQGGVPGTNTLLGGPGPVTGENYDNWTGLKGDLYRMNPSYSGPVAGGPDFANQLAAAYFQQQAAQYSREYSDSAMVSAV